MEIQTILLLLGALAIYWLWRELARLESKLLGYHTDFLICRCEISLCRDELEDCRKKLALDVNALSDKLAGVARGLRNVNDDLESKIAENSRGLCSCLEAGMRTKDLLDAILRDGSIVQKACFMLARSGDLKPLMVVYDIYGQLSAWGGGCINAILGMRRELDDNAVAVLEWLKNTGCSPKGDDVSTTLRNCDLCGFAWVLANITDEDRAAWLSSQYYNNNWDSCILPILKNVELLTLALASGLFPTSLLQLAGVVTVHSHVNAPAIWFHILLSKTGDSTIDNVTFNRVFSTWCDMADEDTAVMIISTFSARVDGKLVLPLRQKGCVMPVMKPKVSEWAQLQVKNGAVWA